MNEQELNKKLAEWAGFRHIAPKYCESCKRQELPYWVKEGIGRRLDSSEVLIFTQSLDACFKWLVPKLEENKPITIEFERGIRAYDCNIYIYGRQRSSICAETPALALCLAIEKLIDKEVEP